MPFVGGRVDDDDDGAHSGRKRRWHGDDGDVYRLYSPGTETEIYVLNHPEEVVPRRILPLSKRPRITDDEAPFHDDLAPAHRRRTSLHKLLQNQPGLGNRASARPGSSLLTPCHICHRKPTKKSDLDSFAACQGCGERTCYVCIRECHGWNVDEGAELLSEQEVLSRSFHMDDAEDVPLDQPAQEPQDDERHEVEVRHENTGHHKGKGWHVGGHRTVVCSRCCIEKGRQGEVVCLGCLAGMPGA